MYNENGGKMYKMITVTNMLNYTYTMDTDRDRQRNERIPKWNTFSVCVSVCVNVSVCIFHLAALLSQHLHE